MFGSGHRFDAGTGAGAAASVWPGGAGAVLDAAELPGADGLPPLLPPALPPASPPLAPLPGGGADSDSGATEVGVADGVAAVCFGSLFPEVVQIIRPTTKPTTANAPTPATMRRRQ